jgi:hypothetical protein
MVAYTELFIDQGASYNNIITLTDDVTNANINLVGYSVSSQIKKSYYSNSLKGNIVCSLTDAPNGEITLTMTAANTALLNSGRYVFDIKMVDGSAVKTRILEGILIVTPGVTV